MFNSQENILYLDFDFVIGNLQITKNQSTFLISFVAAGSNLWKSKPGDFEDKALVDQTVLTGQAPVVPDWAGVKVTTALRNSDRETTLL